MAEGVMDRVFLATPPLGVGMGAEREGEGEALGEEEALDSGVPESLARAVCVSVGKEEMEGVAWEVEVGKEGVGEKVRETGEGDPPAREAVGD